MPQAVEGIGMAAAGGPNVFTVPPGRPFLPALAEAILAGHLPAPLGARPEPLELPAYTILLPTRRAARALQEAFLKAAGGGAMLLPAIRPIAEGDEDEGLIQIAASAREDAAGGLAVPLSVDKLERLLVLTRLVMAWSAAMQGASGAGEAALAPVASAGAGTPGQAVNLARDLARLMDSVETENVPLDRLLGLVPDHFSAHWQQTLDFLKVATEAWPGYLSARQLISPMDRRSRLILAEAERLATRAPAGPVIVAGVTGSIPATAELMRAVMALRNGAIVLPALDQGLDAATFELVGRGHPEHPQFGFHRLLGRLGLTREAVRELPGGAISPDRAARNRLVSEAMRPAGALESWRHQARTMGPAEVSQALAGLSLIAAPSTEDEAEAIAFIMREAADTPGRTAALVTPDRLLARRVAIRLETFGIRVDDSAGRPFAKTMAGTFLDLVVDAAAHRLAPADLMALLKHPLTRLGLAAGAVRRAARTLEIAAFRTPYLGSGVRGLEAAVERAAHAVEAGERRGRAVRLLSSRDWAAVRDLVRRLDEAFRPLSQLTGAQRPTPIELRDLARAHVAVAEALARPQDAADGEPSPLWYGEAGEAAARLLGALMQETSSAPAIPFADYADVYRALIAGESVRARVPAHPRLSIWGPLEARLQQTDVVVLGGLNEGTWPATADPGAWLNRPMRAAIGLPAPEEETGRAAHDLVSLMGADRVILTRARKVDGVPAVPSRWLLRLEALLDGLGAKGALEPDRPWLAWARNRGHIRERRLIQAPEPRPPLALRPRRMSVTDVETWISNPYAIYAKHVLALEALPALGARPGNSEKGQILHETLSRFSRRYDAALPADIAGAFLTLAGDVIGDLGAEPRVRAFWLPRFARFAEWLASMEPEWRRGMSGLLAEVDGRLVREAPGGPFTLSARADRIDVGGQAIVITDYKSGQVPTNTAVVAGFAPQLSLEAAMAAVGAFTGLAPTRVAALRYVRASGAEPPGEEHPIRLDERGIAATAAAALAGLDRLIAEFDDPATPYRAVRRRGFNYGHDDYAHLARIGEWTADEESGEGAP